MATASTRFTDLNYWIDGSTGFDYLVQVQIPPTRMVKAEDVGTLPIATVNPLVNLMVRDVATVRRGARPGEYDRDMSQRYLTLTANVEGEDMGRASRQVARGDRRRRETARGRPGGAHRPAPADDRDVQDARDWTGGRRVRDPPALDGLFQSPRLGLISIGAVPGVLAGIAIILYFTNTSLNIESFMGSIMSLGVSVSNSVLLVAFMNDHWKGGQALDRGSDRRRARPSAGDPDDRLRDDHRHGADGTGTRAGERDAGPARPGGDRRAGDVDGGHPAGGPLDLRDRDRSEGGPLAVDLPGRPREPALRPGGLRPARTTPATEAPPQVGQPVPSQPQPDGTNPHPGQRTRGARTRRPPKNPLAWRSLMRRALSPTVPDRSPGCRWLVFWLLAALVGAGLPQRARDRLRERLGAPDRTADPPVGPEHRPGRRSAELHRKLRAHVDLSRR